MNQTSTLDDLSFLEGLKKEFGSVAEMIVARAKELPERCSVTYYDCMFGIQKIGAVAGLINFSLKGPEIAYLLDDSKPKYVFVGSEFMVEFSRGMNWRHTSRWWLK